jgi:hypothetical protein
MTQLTKAMQPLYDDPELSTGDRMTAVAIDHLSDENGWCWAPLTELARIAGMHRNNAAPHIKKLLARGWISSQKNPADRRQFGYYLSNLSHVSLPTPDNYAMPALPTLDKGNDTLPSLPESRQPQRCLSDVPTTTQKIKIKDKKKKQKEMTASMSTVPDQPDFLTLVPPAQDPKPPAKTKPKPPAKKPARKCTKNPPTQMTEDWEPSKIAMANLTVVRGIPETFIDDEIVEFQIYWIGRGDSRASWDATFCNRVKETWKRNLANEKREKYTDAAGRPISEYDAIWRDMEEQAWAGTDGSYEIGTTIARDDEGNDVLI